MVQAFSLRVTASSNRQISGRSMQSANNSSEDCCDRSTLLLQKQAVSRTNELTPNVDEADARPVLTASDHVTRLTASNPR